MKLWRYILCLILALPLCISNVSAPPIVFPRMATEDPATSLVDTNFIAYWPLSSNANDTRGSNHLTENNSPTYTGGVLNLVSASNQYLSIADNASLSFTNESFTHIIEFKLTADTDGALFSKNNELRAVRVATSDRLFYQVRVDVSTTGSVDWNGAGISAGVWYSVAFVHSAEANTLTIYRNGSAYTPTSYSLGSYDTGGAFWIGRDFSPGFERPFGGQMKRAGVWRRALTQAEITYLAAGHTYNSGTGKFE